MMERFLETERRLAALISAHEERNKHNPDHWEPVPGELLSEHWRSIENVLAQALRDNLCSPLSGVLFHLKLQAGYVATGKLPRSIKEAISNKGAPLGPTRKAELGLAVFFIYLARRGVVKNSTPVRTIARLFGASVRRVQSWTLEIDATCPAVSYAEFRSMLIEAAKRYRVAGRSAKSINNRRKRKGD